MKKAIKYLKQLGLTQKESQVYVSLVEIGKGTAYAVAKQSGLKRPTVYVVLDELRKKGLVIKIPHAKKQIFIAKDPEELFDVFENNLYEAKRALPELLKMNYGQGDITTHLFDGKYEMSKALEYRRDELANQEMFAFYGIPSKGKKISEIYYDHARELEKQNTKVRVFVPDDDSLIRFRETEREYGQKVIYLPKEQYSPKVSVEISTNFSKIFLHTASQALVIEGKEFSEFLKQIFEIMWKNNIKKS